jgi:hypothetical protein
MFAERLRLRSQQRLLATAEDSVLRDFVLRTEMANLEHAPKRILLVQNR